MSNWNGFGSLDLSGVENTNRSQRLQPGTYEVECTGAEIKDTATGGKMIVADYLDTGGQGDIRMNFNVVNSNPQAVEIGMRQLKSFLVSSNHPNPDKPGDIATLTGLKCKITVGMGKPWRDKDGNERQSSEVKAFMPSSDKHSSKHSSKPKGSKLLIPIQDIDDEIPF